ncbi:MAG TPA: preprotein translocase subunit YajC [Candidatus Krumholzibacteria bacterium]|nr:preprotein translocase subunit YajC [Candidatus Krumholzibacteria bacterium]HPD71375.1 preprotein translocase subunit YajC [Candidatus Krumholzibacteria bacterium]HRY38925.1 preprotein translocase subunit YajC [Candidatus Krumholzibacteria bacterium]
MSVQSFLAMSAPPAEGGASSGSNPLYMFGMMALIFAIFWFMIIRPQQKQQKQRQAMIAALKNGDRVVTSGGLFATVKDVHDDRVVAFIADGVKVEIAKQAISGVVQRKD